MNEYRLSEHLQAIHDGRMDISVPPSLRERAWVVPERPVRPSWLPRPATWTLQSILSATRFVVAGVVVALFGGLLLVAQPFDRVVAPGAETDGLPPVTGPAGNGLIAFGGDDGIGVYDPSSGMTRRLITTDGAVWDVRFSNDGRRLLWQQADGGLYAAAADGSSVRELLGADLHHENGISLGWSSAGDRVLVVGTDATDTTTVSILDLEAGASERLDLGFDTWLWVWWRPAHDELLVFADEPDRADGLDATGYYIVEDDGSNLRPLEGVAREGAGIPVAVSLDGSKLAYEVFDPGIGQTVHVLDIDSGTDRRLLDEDYWIDGFSPDGTELLLRRARADGTDELARAPVDGAGPIVAIGGAFRCRGPHCLTVLWSPDGSQVFAATQEQEASHPSAWLYDIASGEGHRIDLEGWTAAVASWQRLASDRAAVAIQAEAAPQAPVEFTGHITAGLRSAMARRRSASSRPSPTVSSAASPGDPPPR